MNELDMIDGKPFSDVLGEIEGGQFLRDITAELRRVTNAVSETRKPGSLKLAFKITPTGRASVEIDAKFDAAIPEHDRPATVFFVTPEGTLMRNDPAQPQLPLRTVPRDQDAPRTVQKD
jgi:hypothetical protein